MATFIAFLGVAAIVIIAPGPDTAVTIRNAMLGGRSAGVMTALGIATGQLVWALMTSLGLVAILIASESLFLIIKYAGVTYLVYLGVQLLRQAIWPTDQAALDLRNEHTRRLGSSAAFRQGIISDLGNPKMAVFFASLLPQFVPSGVPTFGSLMALGTVFSTMTFGWLCVYAFLIPRIGKSLDRPAVRRCVEGITGAVLVGLGIRLATEQR
jgi:RhtB (resistance to homoserine/threonine) family protein